MVESRDVANGPRGRDASDSKATKRTRTSSPNGDTPAKRSRVSRACDQCRASREKCDGVKPQCQTCSSQRRDCTYNEPPKKRGIQPNYIRTLELTLAWLFRAVPQAQNSLSEELPILNGPAQKTIGGKDAAGAETLHQLWRNSLVCKQVDQLLSGAAVESGTANAIDPRLASDASDADRQPQTSTGTAAGQATVAATSAFLHTKSQNLASLTAQASSSHTALDATSIRAVSLDSMSSPSCEKLKLPQNSWTLLEYYFAFTQSWLPMTEKHNVLRTMYAYPAEGLTRKETSSTGDHAELWSILALAAFQMSRQSTNDGNFPAYRTNARSLIPSGHDTDDDSSSLRIFEKGHIRALMILSLLSVSSHSWHAAWLEIGLAVRLVLQMYAQADRNTGDRSDRPVLHLAAYIIENTIARHIGLVPHMRAESIMSFDSLDEDGLEEWAPWTDPTSPISRTTKAPSKAFSTFNALVHELRASEEDLSTPGQSDHQPQTVLALLDNACKREHREQPSKLAAGVRSPELSMSTQPVALSTEHLAPVASIPQSIGATQQSQFLDPLAQIYQPGHASYLSITSDPGSLNFPQDQATARSSSLDGATWPNYNVNAGHSTGGDIFEELAMLDSVEPMGQHPQFMQNLGFGPDLDLAEFFGSDYQPSNPLLAYMQPQSTSNKRGGDYG